MAFDVERLLQLWSDPLPEDDATAADLLTRACVMHRALEEPQREVLAVSDAGESVAVAFRLAGRQVGPLDTPVGRVAPTGRGVDVRTIDILTFSDGRINAIWMVADWLTALAGADVVHLSTQAPQEASAGAVGARRGPCRGPCRGTSTC